MVAVFDDQSDAKEALAALTKGGFPSSKARLTSPESNGTTASKPDSVRETMARRSDHEESLGEKIADFFGMGDDDENTYSEAVRRGSCVLTVDAASDDEADRATDIINEYDPVDIDERAAQWRQTGAHATGGGATKAKGGETTKAKGDETTIPIVEEQLQVGKREIQKGGVRVVSRVTERPVEETVTLREEHATIKRRPADRAATESDEAFKDQSFEVRGTAEEAVVSKTSRVVEEVVIGKEDSTREQTVKGNVRRTDVDVQQMAEGGEAKSSGDRQPSSSRYSGPERRVKSNASYRGPERRRSASTPPIL